MVLAREVCGAVPVLNFAGDIFNLASKDTGLVLTPNQQAMLLGAVQVVGSVLASSVVEKSGRKVNIQIYLLLEFLYPSVIEISLVHLSLRCIFII